MFLLAVIEDKLKTVPEEFDRDATEVMLEQIDMKFANKIILEVGLCISVFDFLEVGDPYVYPAEGSAHQRVRFRLVVFRPFAGEILTGRISSSKKDGILVSLEFFDDVFIPSYLLQAPSEYKAESSLWVWKYGEESDEEFIMDIGEQVRFRVRTINFTRLTTSFKGVEATTKSEIHSGLIDKNEGESSVRRRSSSSIGLPPDEVLPSVMQVIGCVNEEGLGLVSW
eukprot:CAMPEP_0119046812 /NCGR_PEP_ID=MMETSP1177-20130426/49064_1 /TAXON_ID=2985 /ORGANISM="Ochromonas sp, Strain CCMP1899" /LENGTH=224 /DNA_ID=CAMNT_0007020491 /DNA_START=39 /DNA_END=710 /DNA_ORIENTATION=-